MVGCTSSTAVPVSVPRGSGAGCGRLHHVLPGSLGKLDRRDTAPESERTAAWGEDPVVLRCGVPRPAGLAEDSPLIEVDGVAWYLVGPSPAYLFTTSVGRGTYLQVRVPGSVQQLSATGPLVDLAGPVTRAWPAS